MVNNKQNLRDRAYRTLKKIKQMTLRCPGLCSSPQADLSCYPPPKREEAGHLGCVHSER